MIFTLEALPAQEGDCLLLHWGTTATPRLAVIDGGPGRVYENSLKPRLEEIAGERGFPLKIDLVMVSHVDNDHIVGIKKLFRELKDEVENDTADEDRTFKVDRLWHNTFNDIVGDGIDQYYKSLTASFTASQNGEPSPAVVDRLRTNLNQKGESADEAAHLAYDIGLVLAGHGEARELRDNHQFLLGKQDIAALNHPFQEGGQPTLITAEMTPAPETIDGLSFKIVGPMQAQIDALQEAFDEYITEKGLSADSMLAAYADKSVPNLSSIVCLVTMGNNSVLLTGDARGDYIIEGLRRANILTDTPLKVDVLKVPHHGSDRNIEPNFFRTIVADSYVFSADGKYGNPDRAPFDWLIAARGKDAEYDIVLTYKVADIDKVREAKSTKPWKPAEHALAALFKQRKDEGYRFTVVEGGSHKIELGDPIGW